MESNLSISQRKRQGLQWRITNGIIFSCTEFIVCMLFITFGIVSTNVQLGVLFLVIGMIMGMSFIKSTYRVDKLRGELKTLNIEITSYS